MFRTDIKRDISTVHQNLKTACSAIRDELDDHLDAINQSTAEMQTLFDYLSELDMKIDKLSDRIEQMELSVIPQKRNSMELTHREQEIFMILYAIDQKLSKQDIVRRLGFTESMIDAYIHNMISKGIPVLKQVIDDRTYYYLEQSFKNQHARYGIVKVSEGIVQELFHS